MGFGFAAAVPSNPVQTVPARLPEPLSSTTPDNTRYLNEPSLLEGCQAQLASFKNQPCDIIFIGDSITARWLEAGREVWNKYYAPRHSLDFGIGGDKTQNVLWRLDNLAIQGLRPKVAVVMIGTNNLANHSDEIADGVKAVLAKARAVFPGVKIILVSIMPNARANDKMMQVNSLIKKLADNDTLFYLDLVPLMPEVTTIGPDGQTDRNWKGMSYDRLHPDATGYQIWADAMEPLLAKLLAGGK